MHHSIERYLHESPFLSLPLLVGVVAILVIRFLFLPQLLQYQEVSEQLDRLPELYETQTELLTQLQSGGDDLPSLVEYDHLFFCDGSTLLHELFEIARPLGITFTETSPREEGDAVVVRLAFSAQYQTIGTFLTELEQYPLQLSVSQVAMERKRQTISVKLTIIGSGVDPVTNGEGAL